MIFELVRDFEDLLAAMPREHPRYGVLKLLDEAIRRDVQFIDRHSTTFFQCMWNTCWWYDCPEAAKHYVFPQGGWRDAPWHKPGERLFSLMESWREQRRIALPDAWFIRALRPSAESLQSGQIALIHAEGSGFTVLAVHSDGRRLAVGRSDNSIQIWDWTISQTVMSIPKCPLPIANIQFHPIENAVLVVAEDWQSVCYDLTTGAQRETPATSFPGACKPGRCDDGLNIENAKSVIDRRGHEVTVAATGWRLKGHLNPIHSARFSPDRQLIVTAGGFSRINDQYSMARDYSVRIWSVATGQQLSCFLGHTGEVLDAQFLPDSRRIVSISDDQSIRVWDIAEAKSNNAWLSGHQKREVWSMVFSPESDRVVSCAGDLSVIVWDANSGVCLGQLDENESLMGCSFSPEGSQIATLNLFGELNVWNYLQNELPYRLSFDQKTQFSLIDSEYLLILRGDVELSVAQIRTQQSFALGKLSWDVDDAIQLAISADRRWIVCCEMAHKRLRIVDRVQQTSYLIHLDPDNQSFCPWQEETLEFAPHFVYFGLKEHGSVVAQPTRCSEVEIRRPSDGTAIAWCSTTAQRGCCDRFGRRIAVSSGSHLQIYGISQMATPADSKLPPKWTARNWSDPLEAIITAIAKSTPFMIPITQWPFSEKPWQNVVGKMWTVSRRRGQGLMDRLDEIGAQRLHFDRIG